MTIKDISNNDAIKCLHVMRTRTTEKKKKKFGDHGCGQEQLTQKYGSREKKHFFVQSHGSNCHHSWIKLLGSRFNWFLCKKWICQFIDHSPAVCVLICSGGGCEGKRKQKRQNPKKLNKFSMFSFSFLHTEKCKVDSYYKIIIWLTFSQTVTQRENYGISSKTSNKKSPYISSLLLFRLTRVMDANQAVTWRGADMHVQASTHELFPDNLACGSFCCLSRCLWCACCRDNGEVLKITLLWEIQSWNIIFQSRSRV